jgi:CHAT domain-containing protein
MEFTSLPATRTEATSVAATWKNTAHGSSTVLIGPDATESAFKQQAPTSTIIHIATHGVVIGDVCRGEEPAARGVGGVSPIEKPAKVSSDPPRAPVRDREPSPWMGRRVWLALAAADHAEEADSDDNDGLLTAEEVVTLNLENADWVVLSACHSGLAEAWGREGTLGMRRAFAMAGARCVISSQWAVEDKSTAEWMRQLYDVRSQGERRGAVAVQTACRRVLSERRESRRSTHPFYWAAFTASGD